MAQSGSWGGATRAIAHWWHKSLWVRLAKRSLVASLLGVTLITAFAAMVELDRLIAQAITAEGKSWTMAAVAGFAPWQALQAWAGWAGSGTHSIVAALIRAHVSIDFIFILAYACGGIYLIRTGTRQMRSSLEDGRWDFGPVPDFHFAPAAEPAYSSESNEPTRREAMDIPAYTKQRARSLYELLGILVAADLAENVCILVLVNGPSTIGHGQ